MLILNECRLYDAGVQTLANALYERYELRGLNKYWLQNDRFGAGLPSLRKIILPLERLSLADVKMGDQGLFALAQKFYKIKMHNLEDGREYENLIELDFS